MKRLLKITGIAAVMAVAAVSTAHAQYYEMANQLTNLLQAPLSGSLNYKGFVEATSTFGVGEDRANFVGLSTTQGFQYSSWFYMGVGMGVDLAMASRDDVDYGSSPNYGYHKSAATKVMIPIFSDFRFNIGSLSSASMFIDIKAGATWLIGSSYLQLNRGALTGQTQFLLRPSIGVRIPTNRQNPKQAFDLGVTYQLITANNAWGYWSSSYDTTLNSFGVTVGYEW